MLSGTSTALEIKGQVGSKDKTKRLPERVLVWQDAKEIGSAKINAEGHFIVSVEDLSSKASLFVTADNPVEFKDGAHLYLGCAKVSADSKQDVQLTLSRHDVKRVSLQVAAFPNEPVPNVLVRCSVRIPLSEAPDSPVWKRKWTLKTDRAGAASCPLLQASVGVYAFTIREYLKNGDSVAGRTERSGAKLLASKGAVRLAFPRDKLSARIKVGWSKLALGKWPALAGKQPAVNALLGIQGKPGQSCIVESDGAASYFNLEPGKYSLMFIGKAAKQLRITGKGNLLEVPAQSEAPVNKIVEVEPVDPEQYLKSLAAPKTTSSSGIYRECVLREQKINKPVVGAEVKSSAGRAVSDSYGRVKIKLSSDQDRVVAVMHPDYYPLEVPMPQGKGVMLPKIEMKPYPQVLGKVLRKETKKPVAWCRMRFSGSTGRDVKCDRFGRFSVKLKPGKYSVRLEEPIFLKNSEVTMDNIGWEPPDALIWTGQVAIPDEGLKRDFTVPAVVKLSITVSVDKAALKLAKPCYVRVVRANESVAVCPNQVLREGRPTVVYVAEGEYRLLVSGDQKTAAYAGDIQVKGTRPMTVKGLVKNWKFYSQDADGRIKLLRERPVQ